MFGLCQLSIEEAVQKLRTRLMQLISELDSHLGGIVRLEVTLPVGGSALQWMRRRSRMIGNEFQFYFRSRSKSAESAEECAEDEPKAFSGIGQSWTWHGMHNEKLNQDVFDEINGFLTPRWPTIRCMGGTRFDNERPCDREWASFGSYLFFIPALEYHESNGRDVLACTVAWNDIDPSSTIGRGPTSLSEAVASLLDLLKKTSPVTSASVSPSTESWSMEHHPTKQEWCALIQSTTERLTAIKAESEKLEEGNVDNEATNEAEGLDTLLTKMGISADVPRKGNEELLSKLVLARKTGVRLPNPIDFYSILQQFQVQLHVTFHQNITFQDSDVGSYQFCLGFTQGDVFFGSSPERLYKRNGLKIFSEAVAGTRPRGPKGIDPLHSQVMMHLSGNLEKDFMIGLELLRHPKDHIEFSLVRNWLTHRLRSLCSDVSGDVQKGIIKKANVQHLYGKVRGTLKHETSDFEILNALHPTPAIGGRPQTAAKEALRKLEAFDRGYYAAPLGWISGTGSEFIVAIRSALVKNSPPGHDRNQHLDVFAGAGIVDKSIPIDEWNELNLKIRPFKNRLTPQTPPWTNVNPNIRSMRFLVEECVRSEMHVFGAAPGSRSTPLIYSVASHPSCRLHVCLDERSLGFWSLGFAKGSGVPAPVITTSGTAVGNLLPAVIEAHQSNVPMLLLTADRPASLRSTGANQTIDQTKIFGDYVKQSFDVTAPSPSDTADRWRALLTLVDAAKREACAHPAGPVHLNLQFEEPLAPIEDGSCGEADTVLRQWWQSGQPFTSHIAAADEQLSIDFVEKIVRFFIPVKNCFI